MPTHCARSRDSNDKPSWDLQYNDAETLHFVVNEEVKDGRRKVMTMWACVYI